MPRPINLGTSLLASQLRGWRGTAAFQPARRQPKKPLELFEFEASPYCRLVREALTELDLDALIYPCPKHGTRLRPQAQTRGGKAQFPFLVDPNTGVAMFESTDIINYLADTYQGRVRVDDGGLSRRITVVSSLLATVIRGGLGGRNQVRGLHARPSRAPARPLELYSFEASPYSRPVREVLCELELPYLLRNTGKARWRDMGPPRMRDAMSRGLPVEGRNRKALLKRAGKIQVPYLVDPNTGVEMFESADIIQYLETTYAL
jgi:glutathione S-transferase